jgi:cytochrome c556
MIRTVLTLTALAVGMTSVLAQNDPIATRKDMMKQVSRANGDVIKIAKGDAPFKLETVQAALKIMQDASRAMPGLFPDTARTGGETAALPKVWETRADFNARWEKFGKDAAAVSAKIVDEASFKAAYGQVSSNCGDCHEGYRMKK